MTLEEIFKDQPELLGEPAVQKLIAHVQEQHQELVKKFYSLRDRNVRAMNIVMKSEANVINGTPAHEALNQILIAL